MARKRRSTFARTRPGAPGRDRGLSAVAVAAGAVAWCSGIAAAVVPGFRPHAPAAPFWGEAWSARVQGADAVVAVAVGERLALATGLLALVAALALFTLLLLLVGGRERRRPALGVRFALGAGPRTLAGHLLRTDRRRLGVLFASGLAGGLGAMVLLRGTWPGSGLPVPVLDGAVGATTPEGISLVGSIGPGAIVVLAVAGGGVLLALASAVGLLSPLTGLAARAPTLLRRGHGVTDDPRAGTVRRGAATLQVGLSFALAVTGLSLVQAESGGAVPNAERSVAELAGAGAVDAGDAAATFARFAVDDPGVLRSRAGSAGSAGSPRGGGGASSELLLATPGAWIGVGVRDVLTVDCGACMVGVWYLPVYGVDSTVHAAHPGVLEALGGRVVEGRSITASDGPDAELVGVVNGAFRRHFEDGAPVGRQIRLPGAGDRWVRVVGVVEDPPFRGPGAPAPDEPVLWLSLAQHPAAEVVGVGPPGPIPGLRPLDGPRDPAAMRRAALAPVGWAGRLLLISGAAALLLALVSTAEVARVEARGRARAGAVRLALGAPPRSPAAALVGRAVAGAVLGVGMGWLVGLSLEAALGVGGRVSLGLRAVLAAGVLAAAVAGCLPRARALRRLQPAVLLREE